MNSAWLSTSFLAGNRPSVSCASQALHSPGAPALRLSGLLIADVGYLTLGKTDSKPNTQKTDTSVETVI